MSAQLRNIVNVYAQTRPERPHKGSALDTAVFRLDDDAARRSVDAVMDLVVWLRSLGLGKYEAAFRENEIDGMKE